MYVRRGSSTDEASPDEIAQMGSSQATTAMQLRKPKITLEFEHVSEIRRDGSEIPMLRRESQEVDWLVVYARNDGGAVAQIVEATIRFPKFLLMDYAPRPFVLPQTLADAELAHLEFSNWFSDPASHMLAKRPPAYQHQILPGKRLSLKSVRTLPRKLLLLPENKVLWSAHCDDTPATEGVTPYAEIPFVDRRK